MKKKLPNKKKGSQYGGTDWWLIYVRKLDKNPEECLSN